MDDSFAAFIGQARQYCALIEKEDVGNSWLFAQECLRSLLRLYDRALLLPCVEPAGTHSVSITHEDWETIRSRIANKLQRDYYWEIFEPLEAEPSEPIAGSLSDDLGDIWRDLKCGLLALDAGHTENEITWDWQFSFETHLGEPFGRRHPRASCLMLRAFC